MTDRPTDDRCPTCRSTDPARLLDPCIDYDKGRPHPFHDRPTDAQRRMGGLRHGEQTTTGKYLPDYELEKADRPTDDDDLTPVLLYGGTRDNEIARLQENDLKESGRWAEYECGQVFWTHPDGSMRLIWVGRPPGTKPPIKLSLDVAVMTMRLLSGWL